MSKTPFCATSEQDQAAMFASLGIESFDDLFEGIPDHLRSHTMDIPQGLLRVYVKIYQSSLIR